MRVMIGSSVAAILAGVVWWWIGWPERTATELADRLARSPAEDVLKEMYPEPLSDIERFLILELAQTKRNGVTLESQPRSLLDLVCGSQEFRFVEDDWDFIAQRGKVLFHADIQNSPGPSTANRVRSFALNLFRSR